MNNTTTTTTINYTNKEAKNILYCLCVCVDIQTTHPFLIAKVGFPPPFFFSTKDPPAQPIWWGLNYTLHTDEMQHLLRVYRLCHAVSYIRGRRRWNKETFCIFSLSPLKWLKRIKWQKSSLFSPSTGCPLVSLDTHTHTVEQSRKFLFKRILKRQKVITNRKKEKNKKHAPSRTLLFSCLQFSPSIFKALLLTSQLLSHTSAALVFILWMCILLRRKPPTPAAQNVAFEGKK